MTWSRTQINKLGDRIRDAGLRDDDRPSLLEYRATFVPAYEQVISVVRQALPEIKVTGRPEKTPDSIVAKLRRTKIELARMQDIAGCRLIVDGISQQDEVVATPPPGTEAVMRLLTRSSAMIATFEASDLGQMAVGRGVEFGTFIAIMALAMEEAR